MKSMKKIIVVALVALMGVGAANAQFKFGVKAGVNVNHMSTSLGKIKEGNNQAGWTAGLMTEFQVPVVGLCLDLSLMYARLYDTADKNFIQVPLNVKYKFQIPVVASFFAPYIFTGPSFDFKLGKKTDLKTFQPVWNLGIGIQLIKHLQIQAGYGFGLTNIMKSVDLPDGYDVGKWHNNYWTITAAYLF